MPGFFYPNEAELQWGLLIVLYPYITGLVAGAFIVSALYHLLKIEALRPVSRLALLTALGFLLVAPLPLLAHLGRPERGFEIFWTPNLSSAMAGFGYIWLLYLLLVTIETWLVFRPDIVHYAQTRRGWLNPIYRLLTLGSHDVSPATLEKEKRLVTTLSAIGVPSAFLLHGYVGFIFGAIKANPWWSTPLMPIIFLVSAIVSGIALLMVIYLAQMKLQRMPVDHLCLRSLGNWLLAFLLADAALTFLEMLSFAYEQEESWEIISQMINRSLALQYGGFQLLLGLFLSVVWLWTANTVRAENAPRGTLFRAVAALLVLGGVFAMRWNVVIGGQLFSRSLYGVRSDLIFPVLGQDGIVTALLILALPVVLVFLMTAIVPPWEEQRPAPVPEAESPRS
ncbi:MAG: polysulfide reductase NrfD [Chloroflexi bacterium]|nr:polysulfide reductase NrfD [Chloroflexota bacterium]